MDFLNNLEESMKNAFFEIAIVKRTTNYFKSIPSHMDFEGQKKAEKLYQVLITLFGVVGFLYGYAVEQFSHTVLFVGVGFAISCLLVLPPWPFFRRDPLSWQKVEEPAADNTGTVTHQKDKEKKKN